MRNGKLGLFIAVMGWMLCFSPWTEAADRITMGGGSPGGTYYAVMAAMAKVLEDKSGDIRPSVETTKGSAHAARLVDRGELTVGSGLLDTVARAWNGGKGFEKKKLTNLRAVMAFIDIGDAFLVRKDSGIQKVEDLKGKRLGVSSPSSRLPMEAVLKAHGVPPDAYSVRYLSYTEAGEWLARQQHRRGLSGGSPNQPHRHGVHDHGRRSNCRVQLGSSGSLLRGRQPCLEIRDAQSGDVPWTA